MKKRWILVPVVVVIAGVGVAGYSWWQSPANSSSISYGTKNTDDVLGSQTSLNNWQTSYFTTRVPNFLRLRSTTEHPAGPIFGSYVYNDADPELTDQLAVTVASLGNGTLSEVSGVRLRQNEPDIYASTSRTFAPSGALTFSRSDSYETALFWQHGSQYAAVVVSGSSQRQAELEQALSNVVSNWQWR